MSSERWESAEHLFLELEELAVDERSRRLQEIGRGDPAMAAALTRLLAAAGRSQGFLESPVELMAAGEAPPGDDESEPAPDDRLGPYRLLHEVGRGGMSVVYAAHRADASYEQQVAVKVIRREIASPAIEQRFRAERQILARLEHPGIARIIDGGSSEDGRLYVVLEWVEGTALDLYCHQRRLSVEQRLRLFRRVLDAVGHAHRNLVVHRDLKPSNILVTAEGEPKLLDFGIAKLLDPAQWPLAPDETEAWVRLMTPRYANPEQRRGEAVTTGSDLYSLGVLLHELLTGHSPDPGVAASTPAPSSLVIGRDGAGAEEARRVAEERDTSPEGLRRSLRGDLDAILGTALAVDPEQRYRSVELLDEDLRRHLEGFPVRARPDRWTYRTGRFLSRHRLAAGLVALLMTVVSALGVTSWRQSLLLASERDEARLAQRRAERLVGFVQEVFQVAVEGEALTLRQAVERSARSLEGKLVDQPGDRAELLEITGNIYRDLGIYDLAEVQLEEALQIRRGLDGGDSLAVASLLGTLGTVAGWQNRLDAGETRIREGLSIVAASPRAEDRDVAVLLTDLVSLLCLKGDFQRADEPSEEALELARAAFEDGESDKARAFAGRARVLTSTGRNSAAIPLYREAVRLHRLAYGPDHPERVALLNNLGLAYRQEGQIRDALELLGQAVVLQRRLRGADNPGLAAPLKNLGDLQLAAGELAAAEESYRASSAIMEQAFSPAHFAVWVNRAGIASVRLRQGRAEAGEALLRDWLEQWGSRLESPYLRGLGESVLGECLTAQGRYAEAEPLLTRSYRAIRDHQGPDSAKTALARDRWKALYRAWGRPQPDLTDS